MTTLPSLAGRVLPGKLQPDAAIGAGDEHRGHIGLRRRFIGRVTDRQ
jgi:hypothetical protein